MKRLGAPAAALLLLALLAPFAQAATEAEGSFSAQGAVDIAGINAAKLRPLALLIPDASGLASLAVAEERAIVCLHEHHFVDTEIAEQTIRTPVTMRDDCAERTGLKVEATGAGAGWVGIFPNASATLDLALPTLHTDAPSVSTLASKGARTGSARETERPAVPVYVKRITEPHLYLETPAAATFQGDGLLKLLGPTVRLASREGNVNYATGETMTERPGGRETVARWVSVYLVDATATWETTTPLKVAARDAPRVSWDGTLGLTPIKGSMWTAAREYVSTGKPEMVEGAFTASLAPDAGAVRLDMAGELRSTSIAPAPRPLPGAVGEAAEWWPFALGAVVVAAAGGAALLLRRRHHPRPHPRARAPVVEPAPLPPPVPVEEVFRDHAADLVKRGNDAMTHKDRAKAILFYTRAASLQPDNADAWMGLGFAHHYDGRHAEALPYFTRAKLLRTTGEPEAMCAKCHIQLGEADAAAANVAEAIGRPFTHDAASIIRFNDDLWRLVQTRPALKAAWDACEPKDDDESPAPLP